MQEELSGALKAWLAENLAMGCDPARLKTDMMGQGCPEALADQEIQLVLQSPYFLAARRCVTLLNKRESLLKTLDYYKKFDPDHFRIDRRPLPAYADFQKIYMAHNRPVIFTGAFEHWPARAWTLDSLLEKIGADTLVEVQAGRSKDPNYEINNRYHRATMSFGEFTGHMKNSRGNDVYMTANNFILDRPEFAFMREDVGNLGDDYLNADYLAKSMFLWMGPEGIVTAMHQDLNHIFFCQIYGRKTFRMYPAVEVPYIYNRQWIFSPVDPLKPDYDAYPQFRNATCVEVTVDAGDMLYIPIGWWHHVVGETASISVSLTNLRGMPNHYIDYPPDLVDKTG